VTGIILTIVVKSNGNRSGHFPWLLYLLGLIQRFRPDACKAGQFSCPVDETMTLRTNLIWSKDCVEYTSPAETFVFFRAFVVKNLC
jgi:hypothetical protein